MGFWSHFGVAFMPILQVLLICILGAFLATEYLNLVPTDAWKSLNKIVFLVFTPLVLASLSKTVTLLRHLSEFFYKNPIPGRVYLGLVMQLPAQVCFGPESR